MKAQNTSRPSAATRLHRPEALVVISLLAGMLFSTGCATRVTASGGRETNVLGGAVTVSSASFQPPTPAAAADVDTSKLIGRGNPSGKRVSLFWGLINLHDY